LQSDRKPFIFLKPVFVHDDEVPGQNKRHGQQNIAFLVKLPQIPDNIVKISAKVLVKVSES
jgi:hypothetical protein